MSQHTHGAVDPVAIERRCDAAVVGASAAGLAAALQLGRQGRSVIVVDSGEPHQVLAGGEHGRPGQEDAAPAEVLRDKVRSYGVEILTGTVEQVTRLDAGHLRIESGAGYTLVARRVLVATGLTKGPVATFLGLKPVPHRSGLGAVVEADATGATGVPGLYAAGSATDPTLQPQHAAEDGGRVGAGICSDLADEDLRGGAQPSSHQADWDHRYSRDVLWSGNPNAALVDEVSALRPGRALDVGAGEGGDAVWLAARGWRVVATDISERALARVVAAAEARGVAVECRQVDANAPGGFGSGAYDLVSAHYASISRTPGATAAHNIVDAVAPGGTLLVVGHDPSDMRDSGGHGRPFDPDAFVSVGDVAAVVTSAGWVVEVYEKRARPASPSSPHVHDIVLRARRPAR